MENDKITEELRKFADTFKNAQTERKAVILIPTYEGFMVHEVTKEIGLHAVAAQAERAEVCRCLNTNCIYHKGRFCMASAWSCEDRQT